LIYTLPTCNPEGRVWLAVSTGGSKVSRIDATPLSRIVAAANGQAVWVSEYLTRTQCQIRQLSLSGNQIGPVRQVA